LSRDFGSLTINFCISHRLKARNAGKQDSILAFFVLEIIWKYFKKIGYFCRISIRAYGKKQKNLKKKWTFGL